MGIRREENKVKRSSLLDSLNNYVLNFWIFVICQVPFIIGFGNAPKRTMVCYLIFLGSTINWFVFLILRSIKMRDEDNTSTLREIKKGLKEIEGVNFTDSEFNEQEFNLIKKSLAKIKIAVGVPTKAKKKK
jgi:hypothetical protein